MKARIKKLFEEAYEFVKRETGENRVLILNYPFREYMLIYNKLDPFLDIGYSNIHIYLSILKEAGILDLIIDKLRKGSGHITREKYAKDVIPLSALYLILAMKLLEEETGDAKKILKDIIKEDVITKDLILAIASPQSAAALLIYNNTRDKFERLLKTFIDFMLYFYENEITISEDKKDIDELIQKISQDIQIKGEINEFLDYAFVYAWREEVVNFLDPINRLRFLEIGPTLKNAIIDDVSSFVYASYHTKQHWKYYLDEVFSDESKNPELDLFSSPLKVKETIEKFDDFKLATLGIYSLYLFRREDTELKYEDVVINLKDRKEHYNHLIQTKLKDFDEKIKAIHKFKMPDEYKRVIEIIKEYQGEITFDLFAPNGVLAYTFANDELKRYYIALTPFIAGGILGDALMDYYWNKVYTYDEDKEVDIWELTIGVPYFVPDYVKDAARKISLWSRHLYSIWMFMEHAWERASEILAKQVDKDVENAWREIIKKDYIPIDDLIEFYNTYSSKVLVKEDVRYLFDRLKAYYETQSSQLANELDKVANLLYEYKMYIEGKGSKPQRLTYTPIFKIIQVFLHEAFHIFEGDVFEEISGGITETRKEIYNILIRIYKKLYLLKLVGQQIKTKDEWKQYFSDEFEALTDILSRNINFVKHDMAMEVAKEVLSGMLISAIYKFGEYTIPVSNAYIDYIRPSVDVQIDIKTIVDNMGGDLFYIRMQEIFSTLNSVIRTNNIDLNKLGLNIDDRRELLQNYVNYRASQAIKQAILAVMYNPYANLNKFAPELKYVGLDGVIFYAGGGPFALPWVHKYDYTEIPYPNLAMRVAVYNATTGNNIVILKNGVVYMANLIDLIEQRLQNKLASGEISEHDAQKFRNNISNIITSFTTVDITKYKDLYDFLASEDYTDTYIPITSFSLKSEVPLQKYIENVFGVSIPYSFIEAFVEYASERGLNIKEGKINWTDVRRISSNAGEMLARLIINYVKEEEHGQGTFAAS